MHDKRYDDDDDDDALQMVLRFFLLFFFPQKKLFFLLGRPLNAKKFGQKIDFTLPLNEENTKK